MHMLAQADHSSLAPLMMMVMFWHEQKQVWSTCNWRCIHSLWGWVWTWSLGLDL